MLNKTRIRSFLYLLWFLRFKRYKIGPTIWVWHVFLDTLYIEQWLERKKLVEELKQRKTEDPKNRFIIRRNEVHIVPVINCNTWIIVHVLIDCFTVPVWLCLRCVQGKPQVGILQYLNEGVVFILRIKVFNLFDNNMLLLG